jgi:hypothetical protein
MQNDIRIIRFEHGQSGPFCCYQTDLLQIIGALHSPTGFASGINGRYQKPSHNTNDGYYHQNFDQRKTHGSRSNHDGDPLPRDSPENPEKTYFNNIIKIFVGGNNRD